MIQSYFVKLTYLAKENSECKFYGEVFMLPPSVPPITDSCCWLRKARNKN